MQTTRMSFRSSAPTTDFYHGADIIAQSQSGNYSIVRISATAINRGGTGSYDNNQGAHTAAVDGYGQAQRTGSMPSGYGTNATRWDVDEDIRVGHDSNGYMAGVTLRQTVSGWFSNVQAVTLSGFARIPKRPGPTTKPVVVDVLPTSIAISWDHTTTQGGSPIDKYLVRYWPNAAGTGTYVNASENLTTSRVISGLTPGKEYRIVVYAHNGSSDLEGYSVMSEAIVVRTLSGMWHKYQSAWHRTIPYLKVAGKWKPVAVFIKSNGSWKRSG